MKVNLIFLFVFVSILLGCGEVEEGEDDAGGKASVVSTYPAVGSEVENGSNLTITFDDGDQIVGKQITISGALLIVAGNQANWKIQGLSEGEQMSLMVVWQNTDGSNGNHVLVFSVKGKEDEKQLYEDVILKGDIVVTNSYTWNGDKWVSDRKIHRLETFAVPSTAESIKFSGSFQAKFPVQIFLRDELGYTKWLAKVDEGVTSDWVVNWEKEGSVSIPISAGEKYHLTFFFLNDDCRGLLCLGAKEKSVIIASDFKVSYMN